jgi:hypothetical protein
MKSERLQVFDLTRFLAANRSPLRWETLCAGSIGGACGNFTPASPLLFLVEWKLQET